MKIDFGAHISDFLSLFSWNVKWQRNSILQTCVICAPLHCACAPQQTCACVRDPRATICAPRASNCVKMVEFLSVSTISLGWRGVLVPSAIFHEQSSFLTFQALDEKVVQHMQQLTLKMDERVLACVIHVCTTVG